MTGVEKVKARIEEIAAKRRVSMAEIRKPPDAKWFWRFCKFCGDFYNRKLEPWSTDGATPSYCGKKCAETAYDIARSTKIANHTRAAKANPSKKKALIGKQSRLRVLARWFGKEKFSLRDACRAFKRNNKTTQIHIKDMASLGWLVRLDETGPQGRVFYRLSDHEETAKAMKLVEMKEGAGKC